MITSYKFSSDQKGKEVLFFGAVHGNEKCGSIAMERIMQEIRSGKLPLQKGGAVFVPAANPRAYKKNVRYVQENLNRVFRRSKIPRSYEARLANELSRLIDSCDVLLDVHSTSESSAPFLFIDYPVSANKELARALGPKVAIVGWPALYKKSGFANGGPGTLTYAQEKKKVALLVECGQHKDQASIEVAYRSMLNTLRHFGILSGGVRPKKLKTIKVTKVFFRSSSGGRFAKKWKHLQRVKKGEALFFDPNNKATLAPYDAYILLPYADAPVGDEWLYLGRQV